MSKLRPLKLPYGIKDGKLVHVSQVASGKACGCCFHLDEKMPLVARKGEIYREHFAAKSMCDPVAARETLFHRLAKQVLCEARCLRLPSIELELEDIDVPLRPVCDVENLQVLPEQQIDSSAFRADCLATVIAREGPKTLVVEWVVAHPCEPEKVEFLRTRRIPSVEIDIGQEPESLSPDDAKKWILFDASRKWIWHPTFDWNELRKRGLALERRTAYEAVRFFKTRKGTKAVKQRWVKSCPLHSRIVSLSLCCRCPCAYYVEYFQGGYVDCLGESKQRFLDKLLAASDDELRSKLNSVIDDDGLWYERATPNLGSGFRVGWDKPRSDLVPEIADEMKRGPFAESPNIRGQAGDSVLSAFE